MMVDATDEDEELDELFDFGLVSRAKKRRTTGPEGKAGKDDVGTRRTSASRSFSFPPSHLDPLFQRPTSHTFVTGWQMMDPFGPLLLDLSLRRRSLRSTRVPRRKRARRWRWRRVDFRSLRPGRGRRKRKKRATPLHSCRSS